MGGRRIHAVVRGRVQGVGFRATTLGEARALGLHGWVRNRADGSVEVEAAGDPATLERFVEFLHRGPPGARVSSVNVEWLADEGGASASSFELRRTE